MKLFGLHQYESMVAFIENDPAGQYQSTRETPLQCRFAGGRIVARFIYFLVKVEASRL